MRYKNDFNKWVYGGSGSGFPTENRALAAGELYAQEFNPADAGADGLTLRKAFEEKCQYNDLRQSTIDMNTKVLKHFDTLMDIEVQEIDPTMIKKRLDAVKAYSTKKLYLSIVSSVFNYCIGIRDIDMKNPCKKIKLRKPADQAKKKVRVIEETEIKEIYAVLQEYNPNRALLFLTMAYTGMRVSEALALEHKDIDFANNTVTVNKQNYKTYGVTKTTKSHHSHRVIPLAATLKAELLKNPRIGPLFERIAPNILTIQYRKAGHDITNHQLRHSFASRLIESGLSYKRVAQILGDKEETVIKTYSHASADMVEKSEKLIQSF